LLGTDTGYFQVTFPGPADNLDRIRVPKASLVVTPAIEAQLNERQKKALTEVLKSGSVSSGWLVKKLHVTYDTANRDLLGLAELSILVRRGKGRASKYLLYETETGS
jgi:predicted HTH transcriptional regulator